VQTRSGFFGVYPMVYALFDARGDLAREAMRRQVAAMLKHRVHGIAVLGLASDVNKLSTAERHRFMEWVAEDVAGKLPIAVTVAETSVPGQIEFVKAAASLGAKWAILQPPPVKGVGDAELIRFFGAVADASPLPIAIQNAPEYLGNGLSHAGINALRKAHANVAIVKLEASAVAIARLCDQVDGALDVFNGHGGIDMVDALRAGAVGIIPGGEAFDVLARLFDDMASDAPDGPARAQRRYEEVLPLLVFLMESIDTFLVYGKRVLGDRLGIEEIHPRLPHAAATPFGIETVKRYAASLGKL